MLFILYTFNIYKRKATNYFTSSFKKLSIEYISLPSKIKKSITKKKGYVFINK